MKRSVILFSLLALVSALSSCCASKATPEPPKPTYQEPKIA